MNQQGLSAKEVEIGTGSIADPTQVAQKVSSVVNSIKEQGFSCKRAGNRIRRRLGNSVYNLSSIMSPKQLIFLCCAMLST
ncbi:MAG: hypothetical protein ACR2IS_06010 [Nitrososphaeraceae archaeon]